MYNFGSKIQSQLSGLRNHQEKHQELLCVNPHRGPAGVVWRAIRAHARRHHRGHGRGGHGPWGGQRGEVLDVMNLLVTSQPKNIPVNFLKSAK